MSYRQFLIILGIFAKPALLIPISEQIWNIQSINRSLPAYTIATYANLLNSTCGEELRYFREAVDHRILWSLRMLDSSGAPSPGFVYGNNFWLGSRSQCLDTMNTNPLQISKAEILNNSLYRNPNEEFPPFGVNFFTAHFVHNSTIQYHIKWPNEELITLGLCLPRSCSTNNVSFILKRIFRDNVFLIGDLYSMDFNLIKVRKLQGDHLWLLNGDIIFILISLMLLFFPMIAGTVYDLFAHQKYSEREYKFNNDAKKQTNMITPSSSTGSKTGQVLICFSICKNTKSIFNTKLENNSMPVIYGLRSISNGWIIMFHTMYFSLDFMENKPWYFRKSEGFIPQIISNSFFAVDTYLFISGFLLAYLYWKNSVDGKQNKPKNYRAMFNEFFIGTVKRFIRITPAYITVLGVVILTSSWYSETSLFYTTEGQYETCSKYWWRNLLYINNLFKFDKMCMQWSWYLSNDMQYHIIGSFLLILSSIYFYAAAVILCILLIGSILLTGYISYIYQYIPTLDIIYRYVDVLYYSPWTRIGPYIIGIMTAYVLIKTNTKLILRRWTSIFWWCIAIACNFCVLFGLYERRISILYSALYVALSRTIWALGLAWILIACSTNHGGIVNKFLSCKIWIPLSRLSYCSYLIHPVIINVIGLRSESAVHLDILHMIIMFLGYYIVSYICAFALSLMSEIPYILLIRMLVQYRRGNKSD